MVRTPGVNSLSPWRGIKSFLLSNVTNSCSRRIKYTRMSKSVNRDSVIGILTRYGPEVLGFEPQQEQDIFPSPYLSIPALEPNQPNIHWVPGLIPGVKLPKRGVDRPSPPNTEVRMCRTLLLHPHCTFYGNYGMTFIS
jgi:hypothetical protein